MSIEAEVGSIGGVADGVVGAGEIADPEELSLIHIFPPLATTVVLTLLAALIVLRQNATVKSLDFIVPVMAVCYFVITVGIVAVSYTHLNDCANMVLACGASPIMADDAAEVEEITAICGGLNINLSLIHI